MHDWVKVYERFWTHQLDRIKMRAEQKMAERIARENQIDRDQGGEMSSKVYRADGGNS